MLQTNKRVANMQQARLYPRIDVCMPLGEPVWRNHTKRAVRLVADVPLTLPPVRAVCSSIIFLEFTALGSSLAASADGVPAVDIAIACACTLQ